ncbi:MAG: tRNA (cytidine(34)-2'-O)-methyltransferase [Candidatus Neomarinimicrobiota bacterium]|tara:strand:+ start:1326 stop:1778 length:453 start_codon:yes stop_codon:yes gene_type:complete
MLTISLFEPQIPPNTGNIARLCGANNIKLDLVGKLGFEINDRYLKRAGLDYWTHINWEYFSDIDDYCNNVFKSSFHLLTTKSKNLYTKRVYSEGDYLIFGSETKGISEKILNAHPKNACTIPMTNKNIRSLNLATSVGIVLYEALRQIND